MKRFALAGVTALAIAGSTAVYAQHRPWFNEHMEHSRINPADRAAFADARIAAGFCQTADRSCQRADE
jgi:hypothetical protein